MNLQFYSSSLKMILIKMLDPHYEKRPTPGDILNSFLRNRIAMELEHEKAIGKQLQADLAQLNKTLQIPRKMSF